MFGIVIWFCKVFVTSCWLTLGTWTWFFLVSKTLVAVCSIVCIAIAPGPPSRWWWLGFLTCWSCWWILLLFSTLTSIVLVFPEALSRLNFVLQKFYSNLSLCHLLLFQSKRFCLQLCVLFLSNKGCFCLKLCHKNLFLYCSLHCTSIISWLMSLISLNMSLSSDNYLFAFISFWSEYSKSCLIGISSDSWHKTCSFLVNNRLPLFPSLISHSSLTFLLVINNCFRVNCN